MCVVAFCSFGTAADDKSEAKEKKGAASIAERIWWGTEFDLTLNAPDTGEKFQRTQAGTVWDHLVFSNCFAADGKGAFVAVVRFPDAKDVYTIRSFGPAEDLYAIQTYRLEKTFPKLYKKLMDGVKNSADVKVGGIELPANAKEIDPIPRALVPVVMTAARKYEEKRPELVLRVKKDSVLFFPRGERGLGRPPRRRPVVPDDGLPRPHVPRGRSESSSRSPVRRTATGNTSAFTARKSSRESDASDVLLPWSAPDAAAWDIPAEPAATADHAGIP